MKCSACVAAGKRSRVYIHGGRSTLMSAAISAAHYDEDGVYHRHDPNYTDYAYSCSNGHKWTVRKYSKCPSCDWTNEPKEQAGDSAEVGA